MVQREVRRTEEEARYVMAVAKKKNRADGQDGKVYKRAYRHGRTSGLYKDAI